MSHALFLYIMKSLALIFLVTLMGTAHADFGPSVWQRMQNGDVNLITGQVASLEIGAGRAGFTLKSSDRNYQLCQDIANDGMHSDEQRSAVLMQELEILRQAYNLKQPVEIGLRSQWDACVASVRLAQPQAVVRPTRHIHIKTKPHRHAVKRG